jgi:hypothetical protein
MFCPSCGRENQQDRRFCGACGTNLETVSRALSEESNDFLSRTETGMDYFIARYAEHIFRGIGKSWLVLGQGLLTTFIDMLLMILMWNFLPLRFFILLITTPIRLLTDRGSRPKRIDRVAEEKNLLNPLSSAKDEWLPAALPSVSEHTTDRLEDRHRPPKASHSNSD